MTLWYVWSDCFLLQWKNPNSCPGHKKTQLLLANPKSHPPRRVLYKSVLTYSSCCCHTWALPCLHSRWCSRTGSRHRHTGRHTPGRSSGAQKHNDKEKGRGSVSCCLSLIKSYILGVLVSLHLFIFMHLCNISDVILHCLTLEGAGSGECRAKQGEWVWGVGPTGGLQ